jgi:hypothetical protein
MRSIVTAIFLALTPLFSEQLKAQVLPSDEGMFASIPISGYVGFESNKVFPDLFAQSKGRVVEALVSYGDKCSVDLYGLKDLDPSGIGDEISIGASCRFAIGKAKAEVWVARSEYRAAAGLTDFTARLEFGAGWDAMLSYYQWDGQNPDGYSAQVGYTIPVVEAVTLRPSVIYTAGFGEPAIVAAGFDLRWTIVKGISLGATTYLPVIREQKNDGRKPWLIFGVRYSF